MLMNSLRRSLGVATSLSTTSVAALPPVLEGKSTLSEAKRLAMLPYADILSSSPYIAFFHFGDVKMTTFEAVRSRFIGMKGSGDGSKSGSETDGNASVRVSAFEDSKDHKCTIRVAKTSALGIALKESGCHELLPIARGPTLIAYSNSLQSLSECINALGKEAPGKINLVAGRFDGEIWHPQTLADMDMKKVCASGIGPMLEVASIIETSSLGVPAAIEQASLGVPLMLDLHDLVQKEETKKDEE